MTISFGRKSITILCCKSFRVLFSGMIFVALFTFCSPKTSTVTLPVQTPEEFSFSGSREIPEKWWTVFGDERLNELVDTALQSNFSLKSSWQRLQEAKHILERESASMFPTLESSAEARINNRQSEFQQSQRFRLELYSSYEIDLWGRIRSDIEAQEYRLEATRADFQTAAVSLAAEITLTWYRLLEAENQLQLAAQQLETNEKMLRLIKVRFTSGQIRSADILRQMQLLEATKRQKILAESRVEVLEHSLAVLLGRPAQNEIQYTTAELPVLPPIPETGIPSELIQRRPDVKSAYNLLLAADRQLASAISNKYPRLTISASISTGAYDIEDLFTDWGRGIAGNLLAPIFRGGELSAEADRAAAVKRQRLYEYGDAVLNAFREVEDALIKEKKQTEVIESITDQVEMAVKTNEQLRTEYLNGMSNYLDILTSLDEEQQLRRDLIEAQRLKIEYRISLYRALAGAFSSPYPEQTTENI